VWAWAWASFSGTLRLQLRLLGDDLVDMQHQLDLPALKSTSLAASESLATLATRSPATRSPAIFHQQQAFYHQQQEFYQPPISQTPFMYQASSARTTPNDMTADDMTHTPIHLRLDATGTHTLWPTNQLPVSVSSSLTGG
jgi:hypothetical protein